MARAHPRHAWLLAALPATARRVRAADPAIAETLAQAGAEFGEADVDAAIGPVEWLRGDAWAVVPFDAGPPHGSQLLLRSARRAADSVRVRLRAAAAARALRRRGYAYTWTAVWDIEQALRIPRHDRRRYRRDLAALIPLGAAAVGSLQGQAHLYGAVRSEAERETGLSLDHGQPMVREGILLSLSDEAVLRVALGASGEPMLRQRAALESLRAGPPPPAVSERVPWPLAAGRTGLADWTVERRLHGEAAPAAPQGQLLEDCLEFLAELFRAVDGAQPASLVEDAEAVAVHCSPEAAARVRAIGRDLEATLADVPRGFAHGDFSTVNLLVRHGRLTGVVDWERAGPGRLPLLDLFKLLLEADRLAGRGTLGASIAEFLLPWARGGGDEVAHRYCARIGLDPDPALLDRLVAAYWLDRFGYELATYADRASRADWMRANIENVLEAL